MKHWKYLLYKEQAKSFAFLIRNSYLKNSDVVQAANVNMSSFLVFMFLSAKTNVCRILDEIYQEFLKNFCQKSRRPYSISFASLSVAQQRQQHLGLDACIMHRFFVKFNMYAIQFMDTSVGNIQYWIFATHISYWNPDLVTSISVGEKIELLRT